MADAKRRRTWKDFPCPVADLFYGPGGGYPYEPTCSEECDNSWRCALRPVYEQAIADAKCARLLRVFEKRWIDSIEYAIEDPSSWIQGATAWWGKWALFVRAIRAALREAGL